MVDLGGVPTRVYEGSSTDLLLYGHRGTLGKDHDRSVELCRTFSAGTGLTVVAIDAPHHGVRSPNTGDLDRNHQLIGQAVVAGADQAAADWASVIDALGMGPAVAYVGFSMGAMHGTIVTAAISSIRAAVFGMAGVPAFAFDNVRSTGVDTPHMAAARRIRDCEILMVNTTADDMFPAAAAVALFDAFPAGSKRMMLWEGDHNSEPPEMIDQILRFLDEHATGT